MGGQTIASPALKLFLPRSEFKKESDARRPWAFKLKHPRREGMLVFAAESEEDYRLWMRAFQSAMAIQVQPVQSLEDIRITDVEMQQRWMSLEKDLPQPATSQVGRPPNGTPASEVSCVATPVVHVRMLAGIVTFVRVQYYSAIVRFTVLVGTDFQFLARQQYCVQMFLQVL